MSIVVDQYPMETLSFDNLPQDSPVSYLDYGGILSHIGELVRQKRKENRDKLLSFLIKKINNVNLGILIDKIKLEAQQLESYRPKQWNKGPCNKTNYLKFFQSHDISLKYLEDMYMLQSKGKPEIKINSLIKIDNIRHTNIEYGVVVEVNGNSNIKYIGLTEDLLPTTSSWNGIYNTYRKSKSVWKCDVVGEFTRENWVAYNDVIHKYNRDMKCRDEFWDNHPVLRGLMKPYGFYDSRCDLMKGELPIRNVYQRHIWDIFKGCIDEKLQLERENQ